MAAGTQNTLRLALFIGLAVFAATLLYRSEDTRTRVVQVERTQRVNACLDGNPRPCRKLLNRLLHHATGRQKRRLARAHEERTQTLSRPKVMPGTAPRPVREKPQRAEKPPEKPTDTRPPATINQPDTTPDRFPPPARIPEPQGPGGPRPGEAPPPQRPERPTIIEQVCDRISLVPPRVC
jgi:hypothetical protein